MPIPEHIELDLHDLCAIILDTHARIEPPFRCGQLLEVSKGNNPIQSILPDRDVREITTIDDYAWPGGVITPDGRTLTRRELEDAFWRCKTFDNGFFLADVFCRVLGRLPRTTTLRIKTSAGQQMTCAPSDVGIMEMLLSPHESCLMVERQISSSRRVVVDLALSQIGGRGLGSELFALTKLRDYTEKLLPKYATRDPEADRETFMFNPWSMTETQDIRAQVLVAHILARLAKVAQGEDNFCRYCGKDDVNMRCSKCKKANFCSSYCVGLGWKYHKVWC
ncbi:hypothetical protein C8T65DRAFT_734001 [Cerioporus squamosus]|nr:hypothetical protein C8T65DRAFT_734001 [Cerioporus squamosus]